MTETDLPETSNAESSICMIQLPPYRLYKLGIVKVPRCIFAVLRSEPPWDQKK